MMILGGEEMEVRKQMELFDKKFVYLEWDDEFKGKMVFVGDSLQLIRKEVNDGTAKARCVKDNSSDLYPFKDDCGTTWALIYYDPLYDVKLAWKNGKQIQARSVLYKDAEWIDSKYPHFDDTCCEFRVKPENKWRPFKNIAELKHVWDIKRSPLVHPELEEHFIWIRDKERPDITRLITGFNGGSKCVAIAVEWRTLEALFDEYEFLDGTPCGVKEE